MSIDSARLEMEVVGQGPALVLVHGAGGSPRANFPFLDQLAEHFTVIAPHLPGSGTSRLPGSPLTTRDVADQVADQVVTTGHTRYALVGYSMGCSIAVELAAAYPDRVTSMALTAGFARARPSLLNLVETWDHLQQGPLEVLGRFILTSVLSPESLDELGSGQLAAGARETAAGLASGTRAHLELIRRLDVRDRLARTSQPLLVLRPENDRMVDPGHSDELARIRRDALVVTLKAGHAVGDEDPRGWYSALMWFLAHGRPADAQRP